MKKGTGGLSTVPGSRSKGSVGASNAAKKATPTKDKGATEGEMFLVKKIVFQKVVVKQALHINVLLFKEIQHHDKTLTISIR